MCIVAALQSLFARMELSHMNAVSTEGLTISFGWEKEHVWQQHDVQVSSTVADFELM